MKKQTMLNEPDEMPVITPTPEIQQPGDPRTPNVPQEDPVREPQELPPDAPFQPERKPDEPQIAPAATVA